MWWAGNKPVDVYVGTRAVAARRGADRLVAIEVTDYDRALDLLGEWLHGLPNRTGCRVWLSAGLCRPLLLPSINGATRGELELLAKSLVPETFGWAGTVAVRLEAGRSAKLMSVVIQQETLDALVHVFAAARVRPLCITPWWTCALREAVNRKAESVAVHDCDSTCVFFGSDQNFEHAAVVYPATDTAATDAAVARLHFNWGVSEATSVARLCIAPSGDRAEGSTVPWLEWAV